jgi:ribose transport system ATP-binding protein
MLVDEVPVARQHTAEVLRPGAVHRAIDDHVADVPGPQFLGLGRKTQERIDLPLGEELFWLDRGTRDPVDVLGRGYDEILYALFGAKPARSGTLTLHGHAYELARITPPKAIGAGCVLIPGDRSAGAIAVLNVMDNLNLPVVGKVFNPWRLSGTRMARHARRLAERFDVRPRDPHLLFGALSGGNQQKVLLAKWLQQEPSLVLLDEPTQGVDVGAREQVFEQIRETAGRGAAVLCASSDHEQLEAIASRVLVFSRGRQIGELVGAQVTKDAITRLCYQGSDEMAGKDREAAA